MGAGTAELARDEERHPRLILVTREVQRLVRPHRAGTDVLIDQHVRVEGYGAPRRDRAQQVVHQDHIQIGRRASSGEIRARHGVGAQVTYSEPGAGVNQSSILTLPSFLNTAVASRLTLRTLNSTMSSITKLQETVGSRTERPDLTVGHFRITFPDSPQWWLRLMCESAELRFVVGRDAS